MIQETFTSAEIYAQVRNVMRPDDLAVADAEREFWNASAAFDAHFASARQHLDTAKAIGNRYDNSGVPTWLSPDF